MIVWLGLNALLTVASMYRLGLYVEVYGLTYLRVRAGIWMVLVAAWLGLIAWQILKGRANGWLALINTLWGARSDVSDRTLDSHLRNLRGKLVKAGAEDAIQTIHGVGIRMGS
jgi:hypothetical protein